MARANKSQLQSILLELGKLPGLQFSLSARPNSQNQRVIQVTSIGDDDFSVSLAILKAQDGWPKEVQQVLATIPDPWPRHLVVTARSFSPGALEQLRKRDANWIDEAGNIRLHAPPGLIVLKEAKREAGKRLSVFSWSASSILLAEFLLSRTQQKIKLQDVAAKAGWSVPQVSNVFRAFDNSGWITRHGPLRGSGVWWELTNPGSLLDAWSAHLFGNRPERILGHRLMRDPIRFLSDELAPVLNRFGEWAVTGWAGLELIAPYTNIVPSVQVYLPTDLFHRSSAEVFKELKISEVEDGGNIELWEMDAPLIVTDRVDSKVPVIGLPRLYSDLLSIGGRAKDGAEHLRETRIGY
ncbi:MAG TPA: hypothetical protein VM425_02920 [Myxococcota bacterium]|nr:hypothetical protein [Myxococcota bacterium]